MSSQVVSVASSRVFIQQIRNQRGRLPNPPPSTFSNVQLLAFSTQRSSSLSLFHANKNLQISPPRPSRIEQHLSSRKSRKHDFIPKRTVHHLVGTLSTSQTSTLFPHRDNPNARHIKDLLRTLHSSTTTSEPNPTPRPSAASLHACTAECAAFHGEILDIAADLHDISGDLILEIERRFECEDGANRGRGLKDCFEDLRDLRRDIEALRGDIGDVEILLDVHCGEEMVGKCLEDARE
ncbi:hypothetical protein VTL71DRAFT_6181 [Oculimacula yallundae]|uniref:Uncharacterized protein n=1 Tax=Oculimacula yallundae TaxID=86028 RepID=A0ABR4C192_9HELO